MKLEELSAKIRDHLIAQNAQSLNPKDHHACAYRGDNGASCAVGCLIPDDLIVPEWEGKSYAVYEPVIESLYGLGDNPYLSLILEGWQRYHDNDYGIWVERGGGTYIDSPTEAHNRILA